MNFINSLLLCLIYTTFPMLLYFFYIGYNIRNDKKEEKIIFQMVIIGTIYLLLSLGFDVQPEIALLLCNIPILVCYIEDEEKDAIIISISIIIYSLLTFNINIYIVIGQYIFLFILNKIRKKFNLSYYLFCFIFYILCLQSFYLKIGIRQNAKYTSFEPLKLFLTLTFLLFLTFIICYIVKATEILKSYHNTCEELTKEKNLRLSLFKITHEVKNPLAVVSGYIDILEKKGSNNCDKYLPIIKEEVEHALMILEDISSFSKIKVEKNFYYLDKLFEDSIEMIEGLLEQENIKMITHIDKNVYVNIDYIRIKQVVVNVIKNSVEALKKCDNKKIWICLENKSNYILIKIIDNGIGATKEDLKYIGDPFYTTKQKGTGLGIALSKEIIKAHGGYLKMKSSDNKGMTTIIKIKK